MDIKKIINWKGLSEVLTGQSFVVRSNRKNKKYEKQIESLEKYLKEWAKENKMEEKI